MYSSIVLSTSEEMDHQYDDKNDLVILPFSPYHSFQQYIFQVIATYRVGYKEKYSSLTFSIDPGTKFIGIATFLDDYFLESHTFYSKEELIAYIEIISTFPQSDDFHPLKLYFKIGKGILSLIKDIIDFLLSNQEESNRKRIFLVDEVRSSKIRLSINNKKLPKHESAAILLALKEGLEISRKDLNRIVLKSKKGDKNDIWVKKSNFHEYQDEIKKIKIIAEDVINDHISYKEAMNRIDGIYEKRKFNLI